MVRSLVDYFSGLGIWAIPFSLAINGFINIIGFIPSVFITTANVLVWGPLAGGILSWFGEMIGSAAAFLLYRKGIRAAKIKHHEQWKWLRSLNQLSRSKQLGMLILGRLTPVIPAGVVNLAGALSSVSFPVFLLATAIGKIPSIGLEVLISYDLIHIQENIVRLVLTLSALGLGFILLKQKKGDS
ncbi:TVP38/TMEM64 family protein [Lihuaxuella thermophila]|uniref:TVP38/TMEM64 family membrane protein n=1 Tax=Lihuaxuella thermophila TaxID=1173111 RepID=A0A1H8G3T2_9BACL|nr:VTT domain-containing protein [Lihuaxuella thermophila]SEN38549.1 Uncharacterized membrane protein YdjX, TVP38/TMEM64 family, SNARE-associated domain [Lihuaxuella thermophila]